jgi:integrase/recombinase XerC
LSTELAPVFEFPAELVSPKDDVIEQWLAGRNKSTQKGYRADLAMFAAWAKAPSDHAAVEALLHAGPARANAIIIAYIAHMKEQPVQTDGKDFHGLAAATINRRISAIRSIIKFGRLIGLINWSLDVGGEREVGNQSRRDMRGPDLADARLLFRAADAMGDQKLARRDRAILAVLYDLGLRRAEVCRLDLADVEPGQVGEIVAVWVHRKGKRERTRMTVPPATAQLLGSWIEARGILPGPLFQRTDRKEVNSDARMSGESIRLITKRLSTIAGVKSVRPHGMRHSAVTTLLNDGRHLQDVQKFGGWATLDTLLRYEDQRHDTAGELAGLLSRRRQEQHKPRS